MPHTSALRRLAVVLLSGALSAASATAISQARTTTDLVQFNIAAQPMKDALKALAKQSDLQIIYTASSVKELKTDGVSGVMTTDQALNVLLKGTGLEYERDGDVVVVRDPRAKRTASPVAPGKSEATSSALRTTGAIRVAQAADAPSTTPGSRNRVTEQGGDDAVLDEVLVTGTHIRGEAPIGVELISISRADIAETGFATVQDVVRSLPQNFGGGPSEDTTLGLEAASNAGISTALNLRGLGAGSTLVLVNGRRMAAAGVGGTFTDVSSIPITVIDRVDVLLDGASAVYGSEAVGGVVNFILRDYYDGAETYARIGSVTDGDLEDYQFALTLGRPWGSGRGLVSYEYYKREPMPASDRELTADSDLRRLGGSNWSTNSPFDNPGTIVIGSQTWAIPRGQDGRSLDPATLVPGTVNLPNLSEGRILFPEHERHSVFGSVKQQITESIELFAEGVFARRNTQSAFIAQPANLTVPSTNAFYVNPTGGTGPIRVRYRFTDDLGPRNADFEVETYNTTIGAQFELFRNWHAAAHIAFAHEDLTQVIDNIDRAFLSVALADSNPATAFNPFGDGSFTSPATLARLRAITRFTTDSDLGTANLTVSGPLMRAPGGEIRLAAGGEYREQSFDSLNVFPGAADTIGTFDRNIRAAFAEVSVPFVGDGNASRGLQRLEVSVAGRYENYNDFGSTAVPKVGVLWSPASSLALRGTWGRSFKAPNLADLNESNNASDFFVAPDPLSPSGTSTVLVWQGNNAGLNEERATTWTVGVDLAPSAISGLRLGLTYFDIKFEGRIDQAPFSLTWLQDPQLAAVVTRNPTPALRDAACSVYIGANPADCQTTPIAAIVDLRTNNNAITENTGIDLRATYDIEGSIGQFSIGLEANYIFDFAEAQFASSPLLDLVDTATNPIDLRLRSSVSWHSRGFGATAFVNYADSYTDPVSRPNRKINSWTTLDLQLSYDTKDRAGAWLDDFSVALNVQNLFDEDPPFLDNPAGVGYDQENADLVGRLVSLQVRKSW